MATASTVPIRPLGLVRAVTGAWVVHHRGAAPSSDVSRAPGCSHYDQGGTMPEADRSTPNNARASEAFRAALEVVGAADPSVVAAITSELADQRSSLKLIASENYASPPCYWPWATG